MFPSNNGDAGFATQRARQLGDTGSHVAVEKQSGALHLINGTKAHANVQQMIPIGSASGRLSKALRCKIERVARLSRGRIDRMHVTCPRLPPRGCPENESQLHSEPAPLFAAAKIAFGIEGSAESTCFTTITPSRTHCILAPFEAQRGLTSLTFTFTRARSTNEAAASRPAARIRRQPCLLAKSGSFSSRSSRRDCY